MAGFFASLAGVPIYAVSGSAAGLGWLAGALIAGLAFGSFLGVSRIAVLTPHTPKIAVFLIPLVCLSLVAVSGVSMLPLIEQHTLSAGPFAAGLIAGTVICQLSLFLRIHRFAAVKK